MIYQRIITGILAAVFLLAGAFLSLSGDSHDPFGSNVGFAGILVRVGLMLGAVWLAWKELEALRRRASTIVVVAIGVLLLMVAVRPRLIPIAAAIFVAGLTINGILRRLSGGPGRR
ncbi:MAG: hypothetical protein AAF456_14270 [Planctomycetota bacterium]